MFRIRDPQESLWQSQFLVTPKKAKRLERSWAEVFRNEALPLIDEERFAPMYCVDNGRPNRAVQTVLGVHLLKEMFNLTDDEALEQLEFNLLWHHALRLDIEETHLPQKTLHNFRVRLMQHDGGRLAFQETTDRIIQALGIRTGKQRLDSAHIMSNIATLTRLGLFCETMRLFLRALRWEHPELRPGVPEGLLGRYLKEEDEATHYEDARTGEVRRRLSVCARDLYRLVDRFHGTTAAQLEEYRLLERLLREQCHVGKHQDGRPRDDDDDAGECKVPVALPQIPHLDKRKTSLEPDAMLGKMFCCTDKPSPTRCTHYEARLTGVPVRRGEEYDGYDSIVGADDVRGVDARSGFEVVGGAPRGYAGRWSGLDGQPDNHVADTAEPGRR